VGTGVRCWGKKGSVDGFYVPTKGRKKRTGAVIREKGKKTERKGRRREREVKA